MITRETLEVVEAQFCVFNIQMSGGSSRWVCDAITTNGVEMQFEGDSISDLFAKAREYIHNPKRSSLTPG